MITQDSLDCKPQHYPTQNQAQTFLWWPPFLVCVHSEDKLLAEIISQLDIKDAATNCSEQYSVCCYYSGIGHTSYYIACKIVTQIIFVS